jgi:hypothetical protein
MKDAADRAAQEPGYNSRGIDRPWKSTQEVACTHGYRSTGQPGLYLGGKPTANAWAPFRCT